MMIRFRCPHCNKPLGVKDHLAGKRLNCPNCKSAIAIPATNSKTNGDGVAAGKVASPGSGPSGPAARKIALVCPSCKTRWQLPPELAGHRRPCPKCQTILNIPLHSRPGPAAQAGPSQEELEALAASALVEADIEEEAAAAPTEQTKIDFTCPYCDEAVQFDAESGGKREPCPNCKRIVKVPESDDGKPKDWRERQARGPSLAIGSQPEALEGAWGTATDRARIHAESLEDAGAIKETKQPVGAGGWIRRAAIACGIVGFLALAFWTARYSQLWNRQKKSLEEALELLDRVEKMPRGWAAQFHLAVGECYAREDEPYNAREHFRKARFRFPPKLTGTKKDPSHEEELLLIDLAEMYVRLGGDEKEVIEEKRISWAEVQQELYRTILGLKSTEARLLALQRVSVRLLEKDQGGIALGLATQLNAEQKGGEKSRSRIMAEQIAALVALAETKKAASLLELARNKDESDMELLQRLSQNQGIDVWTRLGFAKGKAYLGKFSEALEIVEMKDDKNDGYPERSAKFSSALAVAGVAFQTGAQKDGKSAVAAAREIYDKYLKKTSVHPLLVYQLAVLSLRAGEADYAKDLLARISDAGCKNQLKLKIIEHEADKNSEPLDLGKLKNTKSLTYGRAVLENARRKILLGRRQELDAAMEQMNDALRALTYAGIALGVQDYRKAN